MAGQQTFDIWQWYLLILSRSFDTDSGRAGWAIMINLKNVSTLSSEELWLKNIQPNLRLKWRSLQCNIMIAALIKYAINTANASVVYKNKLDPLNCFRVRFHFFSLTCISLRRNRLNFVKSGCRVGLYGCKSLVLGHDIGKSHYPSARGFRFVSY